MPLRRELFSSCFTGPSASTGNALTTASAHDGVDVRPRSRPLSRSVEIRPDLCPPTTLPSVRVARQHERVNTPARSRQVHAVRRRGTPGAGSPPCASRGARRWDRGARRRRSRSCRCSQGGRPSFNEGHALHAAETASSRRAGLGDPSVRPGGPHLVIRAAGVVESTDDVDPSRMTADVRVHLEPVPEEAMERLSAPSMTESRSP